MLNSIPLVMVLCLLVSHWLADFVAQTDKMAVNKSSSNYWLTVHVVVYTVVIFAATMFFNIVFYYLVVTPLVALVVLKWSILNGLLHWPTDYVTSRINSLLWKNEQRHWFFVMIGFDQIIHYTCLFVTFSYIGTLLI